VNGIAAILADRERTDAPRVCTRPAPRRELLLWWLGRRSLSARELAERTGVPIELVWVLLTQMRRDRQIIVAYRKSVEYAIDGSGRKRHVVNCYRARITS
jgi:hypothetical protein